MWSSQIFEKGSWIQNKTNNVKMMLEDLRMPRRRPFCCFIFLVALICSQSIIVINHFVNEYSNKNNVQGVSIVSACMDREFTLPVALHSWIQAKGVDEIILVDWSSQKPVHESFSDLFQDPKITLITVENETNWVLSWAFNLGASYVKPGNLLLKVDCDTFIAYDFVEKHPLKEGFYYAGDWRVAVTENGKHLNGVFYLRQSDFARVNGFDERLHTYGWDDSDIFDRFNTSGLQLTHFDQKTIFHIDHPDRLRYAKQSNLISLGFQTQKNRILSEQTPRWSANDTRTQFEIIPEIKNPRRIIARRKWTPPSLDELVGPDKLEAAKRGSSEIVLHGYGVPWSTLSQLPTKYLMSMIPTYNEHRMLVLHAQHGLSNRLRAIASALAISHKTHRKFRLIWNLDDHVNAPFHELFSNDFDVWENIELAEFSGENFDRYNYMDMEPGAIKNERIRAQSTNHIYVRSAYILNFPEVTEKDIHNALITLKPIDKIMNLMAHINVTGAIGVHVRNKDPKVEIPGLAENTYTGPAWELLTKYRRMSGFLPFATEMEFILAKDPNQKFFISSDTKELKQQIIDKFKDNTLHLDINGCEDRSVKCQQYAVADLWALGSTDRILGSFWSSYSEVAGILSAGKVSYAGVDFPDWPSDHAVRPEMAGKGSGAIYVNYNGAENWGSGDESYVGWQTKEMIISAKSVVSLMKTKLPIVAYTDRSNAIEEADKSVFSRIESVDVSKTLTNQSVADFLKKSSSPARPVNLGKLRYLALSPFATTLYLDTDTYLCSKLMDLEKILGDREILFGKDTHVQSKSRWAWNSGVIIYRNTPTVQKFFLLWEEIYLNDCVLPGASKSDMCALTAALEKSPALRYGVLDPVYNLRLAHENWEDVKGVVEKLRTPVIKWSVKILHTTRTIPYQEDSTCDIVNESEQVRKLFFFSFLFFFFFLKKFFFFFFFLFLKKF